jgi:cell cycle checkpoint protein
MNSKKSTIKYDNSSSEASNNSTIEDLWLDKHAPTTIKELAMHGRKVNDIKSWIERSLAAHEQAQRSAEGLMGFRPFVLALCGGSGCCKSTAVEVICRVLDVQVKRWTDDSWEADAATRYGQIRLGVGTTHNRTNGGDTQGHDVYQSYAAQREEELSDFALRSAYPTVALTRKAPTPAPSSISSSHTNTVAAVSSSSSFHRATKPLPNQITLRSPLPPPAESTKRRKLNENSQGTDGYDVYCTLHLTLFILILLAYTTTHDPSLPNNE